MIVVTIGLQKRHDMAEQEKWDRRFLEMAKLVSTWSKDPNKKVGCVIVRPDKSIVSTGFNGFPIGCDDSSLKYENQGIKLERIIHAEMNAIFLARTDLTDCTMYIYPPGVGPSCCRCSTGIIQAGISRIVHYLEEGIEYNSKWIISSLEGILLFQEAKVKVISYKEIN